jgi:hypothetical protein
MRDYWIITLDPAKRVYSPYKASKNFALKVTPTPYRNYKDCASECERRNKEVQDFDKKKGEA